MFRVLSTPIIRSTLNYIYSLQYRSYSKVQRYFNYKDDNVLLMMGVESTRNSDPAVK